MLSSDMFDGAGQALTDEQMDLMFRRLDRSSSGEISWEDWSVVCSELPSLGSFVVEAAKKAPTDPVRAPCNPSSYPL